MQSFPWKKFGKNYWNNLVASALMVEFAGPQGAVPVEGIFDKGVNFDRTVPGPHPNPQYRPN